MKNKIYTWFNLKLRVNKAEIFFFLLFVSALFIIFFCFCLKINKTNILFQKKKTIFN